MRSNHHHGVGSGRVVLALVLVGAFGLELAAPRGVRASTTAEIVELANCYNVCTQDYEICNAGCCGRFFCSSKCIGGCSQNVKSCRGGCTLFCSTCNPDGAFFPTAAIARGGRIIRVGGPFICPNGATTDLDVTLTQTATGAVAKGQARVACADGETTFAAAASTVGDTAFLSGPPVTACGAAQVRSGGLVLESFQWCRDITLLPEGVQLEDD